MTEFILNAAQAAAEETLRTYQVIEFTMGETQEFLAALEKPRKLRASVERAIRSHGDSVQMTWQHGPDRLYIPMRSIARALQA